MASSDDPAAIYFDVDGVLFDSEPLHLACWNVVLEPFGIQLDWAIFKRKCVGIADQAMPQWLASYAGDLRLEADFAAQVPAKQAHFAQRILADLPLSPGLLELVERLSRRWPLAVVTSSSQSEIEPVLIAAGLRDLFSAAVFAEDVSAHKPDPEPYLLAQSRLNTLGGLAVEDSTSGRESARRAGLEVLPIDFPHQVEARVSDRLRLL